MKILPSLANAIGFAAGLFAAGADGLINHRSLGNDRLFAETATHLAAAHGFDMVTISMMMGAVIALVVSFVVTHVVEKINAARPS